jgi:hypothetical protein
MGTSVAKVYTLGMFRLCCPLLLAGALVVTAQDSSKIDFGRDVRPILSENCFHCHGQDEKQRMAGFRLDVPGNVSRIRERITADPKSPKRMPPAYSNRTLTKQQIATLESWIAQGGKYAQHWAFVPPARPAPPVASMHPIDAFVSARLRAEGLDFHRAASPLAWLRRVSLDLTGLPPAPAELDAFAKAVSSRGEAAFGSAVDRLLASPAYGERMAMDWLDVARYADTHGFNNDSSRSMWRWRDWVIESFNGNQPYNQFITEQLAGDLLPDATLDQRIATGYGRNHVINSEGGIIDEEYRVEYVVDRVRTLGMSWLGLTVECARCHDHKFDPITQKDHYRFFAFFNNVPEIGEDGRVANAVPMIPAPTREQRKQMAGLQAEVDRLRRAKPFGDVASAIVSGAVWEFSGSPKPEQKTAEVPVSKREPLAIAAFLKRTAADTDVALVSNIRHDYNPADVSYGRGVELRMKGSELEFLYADRLPAYAIHVRTRDANIQPDRWNHVVAMYEGVGAEDPEMRGHASWVRIFVDGRELATQVLHDGLQLPDSKTKPSPTTFRVGWDNGKNSPRFAGAFDDLRIFTRRLDLPEISALSSARHRDTGYRPQSADLAAARAKLLAFERSLPTVMVMRELDHPRQTHVLTRGAYDAPAEAVDAGVPEALLGKWPDGAPRNRLGLAEWLTKPDHPLTSRVVVNRFWQQLFGVGLVKTSENFGLQGESPSHPELLDWLAREFIDSGWNVKALLKQMVLSRTYRQDSNATPELYARDPENRLLARGPRFRLPAEIIRDQALFAAGLLRRDRVGGPSVFPLQNGDLYKGIVVAAEYPSTKWVLSKGDDLHRRSMYTFWKRTVPHPTMTVFDAPDREFCVVRRSSTNTPLQALTLLNDPIYVEAARALAMRAIREGGSTAPPRIAHAFRLASGRVPDASEVAILERALVAARKVYGADEQAAYAAVTAMILNLDEVITK